MAFSTSEADVGRLVAGETARLMVTDPPYGVAYEVDGKNPKFKKGHGPIANFWAAHGFADRRRQSTGGAEMASFQARTQ